MIEELKQMVNEVNEKLGYKQYVLFVYNGEVKLFQYKCAKVLVKGYKNICKFLKKFYQNT